MLCHMDWLYLAKCQNQKHNCLPWHHLWAAIETPLTTEMQNDLETPVWALELCFAILYSVWVCFYLHSTIQSQYTMHVSSSIQQYNHNTVSMFLLSLSNPIMIHYPRMIFTLVVLLHGYFVKWSSCEIPSPCSHTLHAMLQQISDAAFEALEASSYTIYHRKRADYKLARYLTYDICKWYPDGVKDHTQKDMFREEIRWRKRVVHQTNITNLHIPMP